MFYKTILILYKIPLNENGLWIVYDAALISAGDARELSLGFGDGERFLPSRFLALPPSSCPLTGGDEFAVFEFRFGAGDGLRFAGDFERERDLDLDRLSLERRPLVLDFDVFEVKVSVISDVSYLQLVLHTISGTTRVLRRRRRSPPGDLRLGDREDRRLSLGDFRRRCGEELRSCEDFRVRLRGDRLRIFDAAASAAAVLELAFGDLERSRSIAAAAAARRSTRTSCTTPLNMLALGNVT
ncbi:unnamed protein product [Ceratitis capitata]|uniref:(Mediterranean fruit fly) hypothetical protein n=1 Tax=Ceratitis capitata TaxID=7213 RepID=A0A811V4J4_CERCA|nr:unnamed protein product [Ceratitis capitata]